MTREKDLPPVNQIALNILYTRARRVGTDMESLANPRYIELAFESAREIRRQMALNCKE